MIKQAIQYSFSLISPKKTGPFQGIVRSKEKKNRQERSEIYPYCLSIHAQSSPASYFALHDSLRDTGPLRGARPILAHIGHALAYVHSQGIIHRDLKPENILFDRDGRALLADFGLAKVKRAVSASGGSRAASLVGLGTPPYMAPEQFQGKGEPLPQSDQYALGCIAYELLTGQLPFTADNIGAYGFQHLYTPPEPLRLHNPMLPPRIEQAVLTALAKDPAERYANVEAFLVALGIHQPASTQADLPSEATVVARSTAMSGSDDPTLVKQPEQTLTEGRILTERSPHRLVSSSQLSAHMLPWATVPLQSTPIPTTTRSASPPFQTIESARHTPSSDTSAGVAPTRQIPSLWKQVQALVVGASALTVAKRLFLLAALIDLLLLLGGLWLGLGPLALIGTILAIGICVCGLALNFFTEPWIWIVVFLLLSPLSGAFYTLAVNVTQADRGIMNWHTFCAYLLLTPVAGILYGLFGSTKQRDEPISFRCSNQRRFLYAKIAQTVVFAGIAKNYLSERAKGSEDAIHRKVVSGHGVANREPIRFTLSLFSLHYLVALAKQVLILQ